MKKGVILQERDFRLLHLAYEQTVVSFEKLKNRIFSGVNLQTASNRLNRLCHGGYLRKFRAGLVIYQGTPTQVQVVFTITASGIQALKCWQPGLILRDDPVPLNSHTLIHDLLLGDVIDRLKSENPGSRIINSKLMGLDSVRGCQVPDAILQGVSCETETAIELELTVKSERRYREIVTNYRLTPRYGKVVFVYSDATLIDKVARAVGVEPPENRIEPIRFSKFEFRKLDTLLRKGGTKDGEIKNSAAA